MAGELPHHVHLKLLSKEASAFSKQSIQTELRSVMCHNGQIETKIR